LALVGAEDRVRFTDLLADGGNRELFRVGDAGKRLLAFTPGAELAFATDERGVTPVVPASGQGTLFLLRLAGLFWLVSPTDILSVSPGTSNDALLLLLCLP
jgi:hypothetical protein